MAVVEKVFRLLIKDKKQHHCVKTLHSKSQVYKHYQQNILSIKSKSIYYGESPLYSVIFLYITGLLFLMHLNM